MVNWRRALLTSSCQITKISDYKYFYTILYSLQPDLEETTWNDCDYPENVCYINGSMLQWTLYASDGSMEIVLPVSDFILNKNSEKPYLEMSGTLELQTPLNINGLNVILTCSDNSFGFAHGSFLGVKSDNDLWEYFDSVPEQTIAQSLSIPSIHESNLGNSLSFIFRGTLRRRPITIPFVLEENSGSYRLHVHDDIAELSENLYSENTYHIQIKGKLEHNGVIYDLDTGYISVNRSELAPEQGWYIQELFPDHDGDIYDGATPVAGYGDWDVKLLNGVYSERWEDTDNRHIEDFTFAFDSHM